MLKRQADSPHPEDIVSKKARTMTSAKHTHLIRANQTTPKDTPETAVPAEVKSNDPTAVDQAALPEGENAADAQDETVAGSGDETPAAPENMAAVAAPKNKTRNIATAKKAATNKPPVKDLFLSYDRKVTTPPANPFWGIKPVTGDARPDPVQPSARESNGQTNPPMWEDRGYRFKRGSRHVKYFGPIAPENVEDLEADLDQEELLVTHLMDMRPTSKKDPTPRRQPTFYCCDRVPKDWNDMQTIKALNDRRYQGIVRITMDAPWSRIEREYLAALLRESPDASILELTERHNDRFKDNDYTEDTGFEFANLSTGRTVESVRHEYTTYKALYDQGEAPEGVRHQNDQSQEGKAIRDAGHVVRAFGKPSQASLKASGNETGGGEGDEEGGEADKEGGDNAGEEFPKMSPKTTETGKKPVRTMKRVLKKKKLSEAIIAPDTDSESETVTKSKTKRAAEEEPEDDRRATKYAKIDETAGTKEPDEQAPSNEIEEKPFAGQPPLDNPDDEDLLKLGVANYSDFASPASQEGTDVEQAIVIAEKQGAIVEIEAAEVVEQTAETVVIAAQQSTIIYKQTAGSDTITKGSSDIIAKASSQTSADDTENESTIVERRYSIHVTRKIDVNEDYDDDEEEL